MRMRHDGGLHFKRRHIDATDFEHIVAATAVGIKAVFVADVFVTTACPFTRKSRFGFCAIVPIHQGCTWSIDLKFADFSVFAVIARFIDDAQLIILEGVGSGQSAVREYLCALIWIDIDESKGLSRVLERDGEGIKEQMQKWLMTQEQHFAIEKTDNAADFVLTT